MNMNQLALEQHPISKSVTRESAEIFAGAVFLALMARVAIPLPFTPVPVTLQTFGVLALGAFLGRKAFYCAFLYLAGGSAGLPVFSGGTAGLGLLGPTGGYLLAFPLAAFVTGYISEKKWNNEFAKYLTAMLLGEVVLYSSGLLWLSRFTGAESALSLGLYPFIAGDLFKVFLAVSVVSGLRKYRA